ncbi:hypothetical protein MLD38_002096 [Melastoma candidum]|uniref:Uncharacterized protein n=1 Tax=Melastoma candidum TaxID=119954 RepID=A0ACB9SGC2_9MYRT|nr:hypothetical protein MLD38_002096 [Melastoma candidum]
MALLLLALPVFILSMSPIVAPLDSALERSALLDLRSSLGLKSRDWPIKGDPCVNWTGVACRHGRVVGIDISGLKRTRLGRMNPRFAVDGLRNLSSLETFNASGFLMPGSVPEWLGLGVPSLRVLDLRFCGVMGPLPGSLGNLSMLKYLYLSDNSITGSISAELGKLKWLIVLDAGRNFLTGSIPESFSSLSSLTSLDLSSNFITGSVPPGLGNVSGLQLLNLSDNSLAASIPGELGYLSQLVKLDLGKNSFSGALPEGFFSKLVSLEVVDLSQNNLDGALPIGSWSRLRSLDLSRNNFSGELLGFGSGGNVSLAAFNVSNNMLYGNLNSSLVSFTVIDLSGNYFQGNLPGGSRGNATLVSRNCLQALPDQRSLAECRLFYSGRGLVFDDFGTRGSADAPFQEPAQKSGRRRTLILVGVLGGLGFVIILVSVVALITGRCRRRTSKHRGVGPVSKGDIQVAGNEPFVLLGTGDCYTYEQLARATGNFGEMNLIKHGRSGDLYRGTLVGGTKVVVKRVDVNTFGQESCMTELEVFGQISHPRFVTLLGHCLEHKNEKLLVYKYMPNRDLATSFYRAPIPDGESLLSLDWITRLKIAIEVAEGLSYLHHECNPPLVHRDVRAGSILLDDKYEVRLGSLRSVCTQGVNPRHNVITRLLRNPRISSQSLTGSSSATCAHDVLCFGKVLLELVTGKLGLSDSDYDSTKEWLDHTLSYISTSDKELIMKIMDPSLIVDEDLQEEVWAMAIVARSCLNMKPSKRPPMKYVLKALENPLRVIRQDNSGPVRLRTTNSARTSWKFGDFGSWRRSSSENGTMGISQVNINYRFRQSGRMGSQSSGGHDLSSSQKRSSNEIFPDPVI